MTQFGVSESLYFHHQGVSPTFYFLEGLEIKIAFSTTFSIYSKFVEFLESPYSLPLFADLNV